MKPRHALRTPNIPVEVMSRSLINDWYTRLSRVGLSRVDRASARYVQGANHYLMLAIACAVPFLVSFLAVGSGSLLPSALVHALLIAVWIGGFVLNAAGRPVLAAVSGVLAPLVAYVAQTFLLSADAGFLLPMLSTAAVSFVVLPPLRGALRVILTVVAAAAVVWSFLDPRFAEPNLGVSAGVVHGYLVANVVLTTFIGGSTAWLNDYYFTRERRRAESRLTEARNEARTDDLTRLPNRRAMTEFLSTVPRDEPYALALADIDLFKAVNDRLGHARGDLVLAEVAQALTSALGPKAVVSRWGGEEFLVVLPGMRLTGAVTAMEKARHAVEVFVGASGEPLGVTLSSGLAAASPGLPWDIAVRVADALLYDAKEAGRNRVRSAQVRGDWREWDH